jgi:hypothetical protein
LTFLPLLGKFEAKCAQIGSKSGKSFFKCVLDLNIAFIYTLTFFILSKKAKITTP